MANDIFTGFLPAAPLSKKGHSSIADGSNAWSKAAPCLICGREPCDPHHLRFAPPRGLGQKVSDEFTVPPCRAHHRELHSADKEAEWWSKTGIDPLRTERELW